MNSSYEQKHPLYAASFTKRRKAIGSLRGRGTDTKETGPI